MHPITVGFISQVSIFEILLIYSTFPDKFNLYLVNKFHSNLAKICGEPVISCRMCSSNKTFFLVINNSQIYSLDSQSKFNLIHKVTNPKPNQHLQITSARDNLIAYWETNSESKNLKEQGENLKNRVIDGNLSDIIIFQ